VPVQTIQNQPSPQVTMSAAACLSAFAAYPECIHTIVGESKGRGGVAFAVNESATSSQKKALTKRALQRSVPRRQTNGTP
jgi:hypothetical protein